MLLMGTDAGELQSTNINNLVDEHARLAYHSARATDPNFQLNLQQDFDPEMGELEVIPQELGRVFLNVVSNACYATDEKRRLATEADGDPYMPTLLLTTHRGEDHAEIRIRDNGNGIPPDVIEKIFNPFSPPSLPTRAPAWASPCPATLCGNTAVPFASNRNRASSQR